MYYIAMVSNLLMRLMWTLTISPESIGILLDPLYFQIILAGNDSDSQFLFHFSLLIPLAGVEIARRAQWNLYRVENEQLNNIGKYNTAGHSDCAHANVA